MSEHLTWLITFYVYDGLKTLACGIKHNFLSSYDMEHFNEREVNDKIMSLMPPEWKATHKIAKVEHIDLIFPRLGEETK